MTATAKKQLTTMTAIVDFESFFEDFLFGFDTISCVGSCFDDDTESGFDLMMTLSLSLDLMIFPNLALDQMLSLILNLMR